jgi:dihydroorotate dehydrogenase
MIPLSNGHDLTYTAASGALGFDGQGWAWEWPLRWAGLLKPELFTVVMRTVTRHPRLYPVCNLSWIRPLTWLPWSPWSCIRFMENDSVVNKVGLYNPGIEWWIENVGPRINFEKYPMVASVSGTTEEVVDMIEMFNYFPFVAIELNLSCPNAGDMEKETETIVEGVKACGEVSDHPIILKLSVAQDYIAIARGLVGIVEAISLNSVPMNIAFPNGEQNPLWRLGGGGGYSGRGAQKFNWLAVKELSELGLIPVIGSSVMEHADLRRLKELGADAYSFGSIFMRTPWKPTAIVKREMKLKGEKVW